MTVGGMGFIPERLLMMMMMMMMIVITRIPIITIPIIIIISLSPPVLHCEWRCFMFGTVGGGVMCIAGIPC